MFSVLMNIFCRLEVTELITRIRSHLCLESLQNVVDATEALSLLSVPAMTHTSADDNYTVRVGKLKYILVAFR
jgi:hypothetical protein